MNSTLIKAFEIIWLLTDHQGELGLTDISKRLNMNKTTVFRHIETLVYLKLLEKHDGKYFLGIGLCELGNKVRIQNLIIKRIHPIMEALAKDINETVNLAQIYDDTALYMDRAESSRSLQLKVSVGDKIPLYCTGLGKAILSILGPDKLEVLISNLKLEKMTRHTITDPAKLRKEINSVRNKGYSFELGEFGDGVACVAVPLEVKELNFVGSMSVSGPISQFNEEKILFLAQKLLKARNDILDIVNHELGSSA